MEEKKSMLERPPCRIEPFWRSRAIGMHVCTQLRWSDGRGQWTVQTQVSFLNGDKAMWKQKQSGLLTGAKENRGQIQCSLVTQPCQTITGLVNT